jgi:hypothetical protein
MAACSETTLIAVDAMPRARRDDAIAIGLLAQNLQPRERTRVLDVLGRRPNRPRHLLDQLAAEGGVQLRFVAAEP